jgi:hypothetical protein
MTLLLIAAVSLIQLVSPVGQKLQITTYEHLFNPQVMRVPVVVR